MHFLPYKCFLWFLRVALSELLLLFQLLQLCIFNPLLHLLLNLDILLLAFFNNSEVGLSLLLDFFPLLSDIALVVLHNLGHDFVFSLRLCLVEHLNFLIVLLDFLHHFLLVQGLILLELGYSLQPDFFLFLEFIQLLLHFFWQRLFNSLVYFFRLLQQILLPHFSELLLLFKAILC